MSKTIDLKTGKEVQETPEVKEETVDAVEFKDFIFGDLKLECSCGNVDDLIPGIEGLRVELPATNKHELTMVCSKCGHKLRLFYEEAKDIDKLKEERARKKEMNDAIQEAIAGVKTEDAIAEEIKE